MIQTAIFNRPVLHENDMEHINLR